MNLSPCYLFRLPLTLCGTALVALGACFSDSNNGSGDGSGDSTGGTGGSAESTSTNDGTGTGTATTATAGTSGATGTGGTGSGTSSGSATGGSASESGSATTVSDSSAGTGTGTLTTGDTAGTTGGAVCGNSVVEEDEACDDGTNAGAAAGDCAPDCSTLVEIKEIIKSVGKFDGNLDALGPGTIIEELDGQCPFGYKALFSDGNERIAAEVANTSDGQLDWALRPWTAYVNGTGDLLAITDADALLGVHTGVFSDLANAIVPGDNSGVWTGMNQDWTAMEANENCNNWTNATNNFQMMTGVPALTTAGFIRQSQGFTYPCGDGVPKGIYCAEQ